MSTPKSTAAANSAPAYADESDIVLCTMGRLTRNLSGIPFPGWSTERDRAAVVEQVLPVLQARRGCKTAWHADMESLSYEKRRELLARFQLTPVMAARGKGCHIMLPGRRNNTAYLLNEEDHVVCHFFRRCSFTRAFTALYADMQETADYLQEHLPLVHNRRNGYLTADPTEAGDAMRFGAMLHLPALCMAGMLPQVVKGVEKLHLFMNATGGYRQSETEDAGNLYSFYSLTGPEHSTDEIAEYFENIIFRLAEREQQVRAKLMATDRQRLQDCVGRAYGLLRYACSLSLKELHGALSLIRMGSVLGLITWEEGLAAVLPLLRDLQATTGPLQQEAELPQWRSAAVRDFFNEHPHHLLFP